MAESKISDFFMHYSGIYGISTKNYVFVVFQLFKN